MPASSSREPTLADLLEALDRLAGTEFHEVDLRVGKARLRVARGPSATPSATVTAAIPTEVAAAPAPEAPAGDPAAEAAALGLETVTAPMVGTFYRRPRPDAEPFVSVGDRVRKGQVLCIIEAMKLMNNIEADCEGEIVEIVPEEASAVQFGDRLFMIRPA